MNKNIFFIILVVLVIAAGVYMSNNNSDTPGSDQDEKITRVIPLDKKGEVAGMQEESHDGDDVIAEEDGFGGDIKGEGNTIKAVGEYVDYDSKLLDRADDGDVVLFFKASWCPSCITLNKALEKSLEEFPEDLTILKVDYDNSKDLKKKYAVTYQHTLVQVDAQGNQITKWNGGDNLNDVLNELK